MATIKTNFTVPCTKDLALIAAQDAINQLGWGVLELGTSQIVVKGPPNHSQHVMNLPKITMSFRSSGDSTDIAIDNSVVGPMLGQKKYLMGLTGQLVNSVSLRVQTKSIAINPTVSMGEGQNGGDSAGIIESRVSQIERLANLFEKGLLSEAEFAEEKKRLLG